MHQDIGEQPEVYAGLLSNQAAQIAAVAARISELKPRSIVFTARGTSDHAALYGTYLSEIRLGIPASLASPSVMSVYGGTPNYAGSLVVGVSQSGGSPDLTAVLRAASKSGATTLAITNNPDSPLAETADLHIDVAAGHERAVAATKTYTAELLALLMLIEGIRTGTGTLAAPEQELLAQLPDLASQALENSVAKELAERYRFAQKLITTGRGYAYPTARETALKLMETSYVPALAFSGADLLHGPLAMADSAVPVLAIVGSGPGGHAMREVLTRLDERRADIVTIGPHDLPGQSARMSSPDVDERVAAMLDILPLQELAMHIAIARGENPDAPRGLKKITETY
ncbi:SIS domain-containing protein [Natronoglycomyces albus]|uniref:SIS domain-containing protein n=1 Tax=Natronoglycomyces albus TaxID=2811108 RepID=A0A895XXY7_9ACTN|nr:SIS domain-containing protein [Natronoglycomyces albus]